MELYLQSDEGATPLLSCLGLRLLTASRTSGMGGATLPDSGIGTPHDVEYATSASAARRGSARCP